MATFWQTFQECGWAAWLILLATIFAVAIALVALALAIFKPRWGLIVGVVAIGLSLGAPACGVGGTYYGRSVVDDAVSSGAIDPSQRERIRVVGYAEAGTCTTIGLSFGGLPLLLSVAAAAIGLLRRGKDQSEPGGDPLA